MNSFEEFLDEARHPLIPNNAQRVGIQTTLKREAGASGGMDLKSIVRLMRESGCTEKQIKHVTGLKNIQVLGESVEEFLNEAKLPVHHFDQHQSGYWGSSPTGKLKR